MAPARFLDGKVTELTVAGIKVIATGAVGRFDKAILVEIILGDGDVERVVCQIVTQEPLPEGSSFFELHFTADGGSRRSLLRRLRHIARRNPPPMSPDIAA